VALPARLHARLEPPVDRPGRAAGSPRNFDRRPRTFAPSHLRTFAPSTPHLAPRTPHLALRASTPS
jgi:hypothetical protein